MSQTKPSYDYLTTEKTCDISPVADAVVRCDWHEVVQLYLNEGANYQDGETTRSLLKELPMTDVAMLEAQLQMAGIRTPYVVGNDRVAKDEWRRSTNEDVSMRTTLRRISALEKGVKERYLEDGIKHSARLRLGQRYSDDIVDGLHDLTAYRHTNTPENVNRGYLLAEPLYNDELGDSQDRTALLAKVLEVDFALLPYIISDHHVTLLEARNAMQLADLSPYQSAKIALQAPEIFTARECEQLAQRLKLSELAQVAYERPDWVADFDLGEHIESELLGTLEGIDGPRERLLALSRYNYAYGNTHEYARIRQGELNSFIASLSEQQVREFTTLVVDLDMWQYDDLNKIVEVAPFIRGFTELDAWSILSLLGEEGRENDSGIVFRADHAGRMLLPKAQLTAHCNALIGEDAECHEEKRKQIHEFVDRLAGMPGVTAQEVIENAPNLRQFIEQIRHDITVNDADEYNEQLLNIRTILRLLHAIDDDTLREAALASVTDAVLDMIIGTSMVRDGLDREFLSGLDFEHAVALLEKLTSSTRRGCLLYSISARDTEFAAELKRELSSRTLGSISTDAVARVLDVLSGDEKRLGWSRAEHITLLSDKSIAFIDHLIHAYGRDVAARMSDIFFGLSDDADAQTPKVSPHYVRLLAEACAAGDNDDYIAFLKMLRRGMPDLTEREADIVRSANQRFHDEKRLASKGYIALLSEAVGDTYRDKVTAWTISAFSGIPEAEVTVLAERYGQLKDGREGSADAYGLLRGRDTAVRFKKYLPRLEAIAEGDLVVGAELPLDEIMKSANIEQILSILEHSSSELSLDTPIGQRYATVAAEILARKNIFNPDNDDVTSHCLVPAGDGGRKRLGEMSRDEYIQVAGEVLNEAMNPDTAQRVAATQRNVALARELQDSVGSLRIPRHAYIHATNSCSDILRSANMAGECRGLSAQLDSDCYPGFVDLLQVTEATADITVPDYLSRDTYHGSIKIVYHPGEVGETSELREYAKGFSHQLAFTAVPNTKIAYLIDTGAYPEELEELKRAEVEAGLYIPILDQGGELVYPPDEFDAQLRQMKPYHTLEDVVSSNDIFPEELWQVDDPGGVTSIAGHMNQVAEVAGRIAEDHGFAYEDAMLVQVAAKLHDLGKVDGGAQEIVNVQAAGESLKQVFDITPEQKRKILLLIRNDELLGEVLKAIDMESEAVKHGALPRYAQQKLDQFNRVYTSDKMRRLALCLYQADVYSKDPSLWKEWRIEEKLAYLGEELLI